jgi:hypothetical protein
MLRNHRASSYPAEKVCARLCRSSWLVVGQECVVSRVWNLNCTYPSGEGAIFCLIPTFGSIILPMWNKLALTDLGDDRYTMWLAIFSTVPPGCVVNL